VIHNRQHHIIREMCAVLSPVAGVGDDDGFSLAQAKQNVLAWQAAGPIWLFFCHLCERSQNSLILIFSLFLLAFEFRRGLCTKLIPQLAADLSSDFVHHRLAAVRTQVVHYQIDGIDFRLASPSLYSR
jgi:hypothetical protein